MRNAIIITLIAFNAMCIMISTTLIYSFINDKNNSENGSISKELTNAQIEQSIESSIAQVNSTVSLNVTQSNTVSAKEAQPVKTEKKETTVSKVNTSVRGLPILMYHNFYDASKGEKGKDNNYMEISDFDKQMKYLSDNNYYYPSWDEVYQFVEGKKTLPNKSVVVTIDDGSESFFRLAIPILAKYNVKATSFIITSKKGSKTIAQYKSPILDFESHSHDMHRAGKDGKGRFLTMTYDEAYNDLMTTQKIIGSNDVFCYPYGDHNDFTKKMLTVTGYKLALTTIPGRVYPGMDRLILPRVRMSKGDSLSNFITRVK